MNNALKPSLTSLQQEIEIAERKLAKGKLTPHHRYIIEQALEIFKDQVVRHYGVDAIKEFSNTHQTNV